MATLTPVRLQIQRSRLKPGTGRARVYNPAPLLRVSQLSIGVEGCLGGLPDGGWLIDVHHSGHPQTRNRRGRSGVSIMTTAAYDALRHTYGDWIPTGAAGESILVDSDELPGDLVDRELTIGPLAFTGVEVAAPCVEFSRWCMRREDPAVDETVLATMAALDGGARGVYARVVEPGLLAIG